LGHVGCDALAGFISKSQLSEVIAQALLDNIVANDFGEVAVAALDFICAVTHNWAPIKTLHYGQKPPVA
jgi:hypothetical protein